LFEEHAVKLGQVTMNVAVGPASGPPLVFLHGGSSRWQQYRHLLEPLTGRRRIYAPDLRGHGGSSWTPDRYRLWEYAGDAIEVLEAIVDTPAAIAGHSLGGEVAMVVAAERPDIVSAAISIDAPLSADETRRTVEPDRERLLWMRSLHSLSRGEVVAAMRNLPILDRETGRAVPAYELVDDARVFAEDAETMLWNDPTMLDAVIEFHEMHTGYEAERILPRIQCPVLLLLADPDVQSAVSPTHANLALELLQDGRMVRLPKTTHGLVWEEPDAVVGSIEDFLDSI
jgi:pimeloyl-ACP methyl ester carboxylesterase